jgi:hypothetical protein
MQVPSKHSQFAFLPSREQTQGMKNVESNRKIKNAYTVPAQAF